MTKGEPWTHEEAKRLLSLVAEGKTSEMIVADLEESRDAVYHKCRRFGLAVEEEGAKGRTTSSIRLPEELRALATMEYQKTKDLFHVMQFLGHGNTKTTLRYTQLIAFADDEYLCKVADNVDQAKQLIESGFEYVTDIDEHKLFRKRK